MEIDISIVIPTCDREERFKDCLSSLFNQNYPKEKLELIVVDDRANDKVVRMLDDLKEQRSRIKYLVQYRRGPAAARNLGIEASLGKIVAFVDDDCAVCKDWVKLMVEAHRKNPNIVGIGGFTFISTQKTPVIVSQFLSTCSIESYINEKKEMIFFPTCNVSFKRWIFKEYKFDGKFPLPGGEDLEFFWRLFKDGYRFIWDKNIKVIHYRDDTLHSFVKQAYIYGRGNFLVQHIHKDHPLLKELKTGKITFWLATLINFIKIPRFSYLLGNRLIKESSIKKLYKKLSIYSYFILHKIFYIFGNILEFFRIRKINKKRNAFHIPRLLILDITHSCNLSCRICDIWKTGSIEEDIDIFYIKKMLYQAKELEIKEIAFSGGEPLSRKDIFEIFDYAKRIKIKNLGVLTNGILIEEYIEKLKPYILDNTISLVSSLDSLKPEIHNHIRNSNVAWQKVTESLRILSSLKKEYPQINFNVITIILNHNLEELSDLANFIKSLNTNSLQFQALLPNNLRMAERKSSIFWVQEARLPILDNVIDKLIYFKEENPLFIRNSANNLSLVKNYYRGMPGTEDAECLSGYKTILVSNHGECTTCFSSYGDIKRRNLKEILQSKEIIKAQEEVRSCTWPCLLPCFCDL